MKKIIIFCSILILSIDFVSAAGSKVFLDNVAERKTIAGITFQKSTFGQSLGTYNEKNNFYEVETSLFNLPALPQGYIYQGWIVEPGSRIHIPAGEIIFPPTTSATRVNETLKFSAQKDLRNYRQYSLTIEKGAIKNSPSGNVVLFGDMDFRLIRSESFGNSLRGSKNLSTEEKLDKIKEKGLKINTGTSIINTKKSPTKKITAPTAASIIGPRIETTQQKILLSRLSKVSQTKLLALRARLPEIKNKFRSENATVRDRSAKIRIINDIETVINYLTQ